MHHDQPGIRPQQEDQRQQGYSTSSSMHLHQGCLRSVRG